LVGLRFMESAVAMASLARSTARSNNTIATRSNSALTPSSGNAHSAHGARLIGNTYASRTPRQICRGGGSQSSSNMEAQRVYTGAEQLEKRARTPTVPARSRTGEQATWLGSIFDGDPHNSGSSWLWSGALRCCWVGVRTTGRIDMCTCFGADFEVLSAQLLRYQLRLVPVHNLVVVRLAADEEHAEPVGALAGLHVLRPHLAHPLQPSSPRIVSSTASVVRCREQGDG
jgi:hypothetical protein